MQYWLFIAWACLLLLRSRVDSTPSLLVTSLATLSTASAPTTSSRVPTTAPRPPTPPPWMAALAALPPAALLPLPPPPAVLLLPTLPFPRWAWPLSWVLSCLSWCKEIPWANRDVFFSCRSIYLDVFVKAGNRRLVVSSVLFIHTATFGRCSAPSCGKLFLLVWTLW